MTAWTICSPLVANLRWVPKMVSNFVAPQNCYKRWTLLVTHVLLNNHLLFQSGDLMNRKSERLLSTKQVFQRPGCPDMDLFCACLRKLGFGNVSWRMEAFVDGKSFYNFVRWIDICVINDQFVAFHTLGILPLSVGCLTEESTVGAICVSVVWVVRYVINPY